MMQVERQHIKLLRLGCMEGGELDECLPELIDRIKHGDPALEIMIRRLRPHETYVTL